MEEKYDRTRVAKLVDHTILAPEAQLKDVRKLVEEAKEIGTYSVCVSPSLLPLVDENGEKIDLGDLKLAVVCGFPSGAHPSEVKAAEAAYAQNHGAQEVDMVINLAKACAGDYTAVEADIRAVREAAPQVVLKVIIESALLNDEQIVGCCLAAERAGADFVKTSTGYHKAGGAQVAAVKLMAETVGGRLGVKASGGIRDGSFACELLDAGATRLGLSGTAQVLDTLPTR